MSRPKNLTPPVAVAVGGNAAVGFSIGGNGMLGSGSLSFSLSSSIWELK